MSYIRALGGFGHHKDSKLLVEADVILAAMSGNSKFPNPVPSLAEVENAYNEYVAHLAHASWTHGRMDRALKRESKAKLAQLLGELGGLCKPCSKRRAFRPILIGVSGIYRKEEGNGSRGAHRVSAFGWAIQRRASL